jgi:hypothetical protein
MEEKMRSICLIFENNLTECISKLLDEYCNDKYEEQWIVRYNNDPCLYIWNTPLCEYDLSFVENGTPSIYSEMENPVVWAVDISGRHDGTTQVLELATALLSKFEIYLMDDYTNHFWTLEEITGNTKIEGHCFFDHRGWYEEYKKERNDGAQ